jgi:hypothetical protein
MSQLITDEDIDMVRVWLQMRRERVSAVMDAVECKDSAFARLCEDAEMCDMALEMIDMLAASDLVVSQISLGEEDG